MDITKLKPSELIRVALNDLMRCYNDSEYVVSMGAWHVPNLASCQVCLAGAVMAKTLGSDSNQLFGPSSFSRPIDSILWALNELRMGAVSSAFGYLELGFAGGSKFNRDITSWHVDSIRFMGDMNQLADDLHAEGY